MTEILIQVLTQFGIPSAITGLGIWWIKRTIEKADDKQLKAIKEESDAQREAEEKRVKLMSALLKGIDANGEVGKATAIALKNQKCNGEVTEAIKYANKVKQERDILLQSEAVKGIL